VSLTSFQKNYIKKNYKKLSIEEMGLELGMKEKEVRKYCTKHNLDPLDPSIPLRSTRDDQIEFNKFNFGQFISENIWVFVGLFFLVFVVYLNSLNNAFVSDDIAAILKNPNIGKVSNIFTGFVGFFLQGLLYFVAYKIGELNPVYFRAINIMLHLFSTFLIFIILSLIFKKKKIAIFAAVIFAVHPILIESITWISGMPYSLSAFFILFSFLFYLFSGHSVSRDHNNLKVPSALLSLLFFFLALISLEKVMVFPAILFMFEWVYGQLKYGWKKLIPYFSLSAIWALIYIGKIGMRQEALQTQHYQQGGVDNPLIQVPIAIINYLKLIFWPRSLTLYHTDLTVSWGIYWVILAIFLVFIGLIVYSYKKNKQVFFWLSFFIITLLPTLTPLRISWVVAERYVYLGSLGIFVVIAIFFDWLAGREKIKYYAYALFSIIILSLSVRTILRNIDWKNEDNLWFATAKVSDAGPNIHNNLGDVYTRQGNLEKAAEEFKKAVEINPRYADAEHNLGLTYIQMGKAEEAIATFKTAVSMNPNLWQSYQQLAAIYYNQKKIDLALESIKKALAINPNDPQLQENLKTIETKN